MVEFKFEQSSYALSAAYNDNDLGDIRFRHLLGRKKWNTLPAAVRARFSKRVKGGDSTVYRGYIVKTDMNMAGRLFANCLRLIGAPLPLDGDNADADAIVTVTEDMGRNGQFWSRHYGRGSKTKRSGFPQIIQSSKQFSGPTGLEEYIGYGIGMTLTLTVEDEALIFYSDRYFMTLLGRRLYLPKWLKTLRLRVGHTDYGNGWFAFSLELKHRWLGQLLDQRVMFRDE